MILREDGPSTQQALVKRAGMDKGDDFRAPPRPWPSVA